MVYRQTGYALSILLRGCHSNAASVAVSWTTLIPEKAGPEPLGDSVKIAESGRLVPKMEEERLHEP